MKKVFFALAAVVALAACSKEQIIEVPQPEAIDFGTPFVDNSTRAAVDPSYNGTAEFTTFQVWGTANDVAIFTGDNVNGEVGPDKVWTCEKKNYWVEDVIYNFAAVSNGTVTSLSEGLPAKISYTANGTSDLVYAVNKGIVGQPAGNNELVPFTFDHLLAKAMFTVSTNISVEGYSYEITNIKIANAYASGVYNVGAQTLWTDLVNAQDGQAFDSITIDSDNQTVECASEKLLIPVDDVKVSYTVTLKYGGDVIWTDNKEHTLTNDLVAANSYNFVITVNVGEEIKFEVENNPTWTDAPDVNVE